ncbi:MAG: acyltransferase family protein [Methylobacter sp.]
MYKSLQAGRAVAAILVVLFHLGGAMAADKYFGIKAFKIPFSFGSAGVEFFFVLSGFIILTAHRDDIFKPRKLASYLKKRLIRIYPTFWMVFIPVFVLAAVSPQLRNTVPHDAYVLLKSLLIIPQDKNTVGGSGAPVIDVAWTLQYEMFFYLCFALLILNRGLSIMLGLMLATLYIRYAGETDPVFPLSFLSRDYILLFVMGMMVSVACGSRKIAADKPVYYLGIGAFMFLFIAFDTVLQYDWLSGKRTILYGLASSLMIFGMVQAEDKANVIGGHRFLQILGDSSYALYLIHYPLISILCKLLLAIQLNKFGIPGAIISYFLIFAICLISSVVFHLWIEKPVTAYLRNFSIDWKRIAR